MYKDGVTASRQPSGVPSSQHRTYQEVLPAKTASHDESCRKQAQQQQLGIGDLQGGQTESGAASSQPVVWQAQAAKMQKQDASCTQSSTADPAGSASLPRPASQATSQKTIVKAASRRLDSADCLTCITTSPPSSPGISSEAVTTPDREEQSAISGWSSRGRPDQCNPDYSRWVDSPSDEWAFVQRGSRGPITRAQLAFFLETDLLSGNVGVHHMQQSVTSQQKAAGLHSGLGG